MMKKATSIFIILLTSIFLMGCNPLIYILGEPDPKPTDVRPLTKDQVKDELQLDSPDEIRPTKKYDADEVWIYKNTGQKFYFRGNILVAHEG